MLKLKLQYFGHVVWRTDSLEKTLMLGKTDGGMTGWDGWMATPYQWAWDWASFGSWWWTVKPGMLQPMHHKESDVTEQLNWNELKQFYFWANFVYHLIVNGSTALGPLSPVNHYSEVCLWLWITLCSHCSSETSRFGFKPSKKGRNNSYNFLNVLLNVFPLLISFWSQNTDTFLY